MIFFILFSEPPTRKCEQASNHVPNSFQPYLVSIIYCLTLALSWPVSTQGYGLAQPFEKPK